MRRPIASRNSTWAHSTARWLARRGVRPNFVSGASVVCALLAACCLLATSRTHSTGDEVLLWIGAALWVQMRLLCNLFDGMLAVEFDQASVLGPIYNDLPDRPADVLILVGAGYAANLWMWSPIAGWVAAVLALLTAYVRVLGVAVGAQETFAGPMAKPHRMALITGACLLSALETILHWPHRALSIALLLMIGGCVWTIVRRLKLIGTDLSKFS